MTTKSQHYAELKFPIDLTNFILLEKEQIYVAKNRSLQEYNDLQMHTALHGQAGRMIILPEFWQLYFTLKSGKVYDGLGNQVPTPEVNMLFRELAEKRSPYRAERIDARFTQEKGAWFYHALHHTTENGGLEAQIHEPLETCLMENCSIDEKSMNRQGLPTKKGNDLDYFHPFNGSVSRFRANSGRALLDCFGDPGYSDTGLGVRVVYPINVVKKA